MKRRIVTILCFLMLGVVINVSVAWAFALGLDLGEGFRPSFESRTQSLGDNYRWSVHVHHTRGRALVNSCLSIMEDVDQQWLPKMAIAEELLPSWSSITKPELEKLSAWPEDKVRLLSPAPHRNEQAFGWPTCSLRFHTELISFAEPRVADYEVHGGIVIRPPRLLVELEITALPLIPILPSFMLNSLVYALAIGGFWFLLRSAPASFRRRRRIAAGRCPSCGYILHDRFAEGCPECGWRRRIVSTIPRGRSRACWIVLAYLLAGLAANLALSWACSWAAEPRNAWNDLEITGEHEARQWWSDHAPSGFSRDPTHMNMSRGGFGASVAHGWVSQPGSTDLEADELMVRIRAGWPLRSFEGASWDRIVNDTSTPTVYTGIILVPGPSLTDHWLPLRPLWCGMVINMVLFATVFRIVMHWPLALRRRIRLRAHRCPKCGRMGGDSRVCASCGVELPRERM